MVGTFFICSVDFLECTEKTKEAKTGNNDLGGIICLNPTFSYRFNINLTYYLRAYWPEILEGINESSQLLHTFHNEDKESDVSLTNKDSQLKPRQQQRYFLTHLLLENGVIYSHIFTTLQAASLPATKL